MAAVVKLSGNPKKYLMTVTIYLQKYFSINKSDSKINKMNQSNHITCVRRDHVLFDGLSKTPKFCSEIIYYIDLNIKTNTN
jgi:hypothetical protein